MKEGTKTRTFERPDQPTFKALEFNGQVFTVGRGLFIHLMKYHPTLAFNIANHSTSKVEFTMQNFTQATRRHASYFKGFKLTYVDIDKRHREEIRNLSDWGEGWWPGRCKPLIVDPRLGLSFEEFVYNYEGEDYVRRLGRGNNIPNESRVQHFSGVEFTRRGYELMLAEWERQTGTKPLFEFELAKADYEYYIIRPYKIAREYFKVEFIDWMQWKIRTERKREEFAINGDKYLSKSATR